METKYWIPTIEEADQFETYNSEKHTWNEGYVYRFYKKEVPIDVKNPASTRQGEVEASKEWYKKSNAEDLIVLEKEREAFEKFYEKEKADILRHT